MTSDAIERSSKTKEKCLLQWAVEVKGCEQVIKEETINRKKKCFYLTNNQWDINLNNCEI